jgi:hypothetical protein
MTKKHYNALVLVLRQAKLEYPAAGNRFAELLIAALRAEPNFNEVKFRAALDAIHIKLSPKG